jgi:hypothetical protein
MTHSNPSKECRVKAAEARSVDNTRAARVKGRVFVRGDDL